MIAVISYTGFLLWLTWPIPELSLNKSGVFGDSYGALTSLFSGLAFSGMLIAILLQRDELKDNREEFKKSVQAQNTNAKLNALTTILHEYKERIKKNDENLHSQSQGNVTAALNSPLMKENQDLIRRKEIVIREIENILQDLGVELE